MSMNSRREYLSTMRERYGSASSKAAKSAIIDELVSVLGYHRKHAIRALNARSTRKHQPGKRVYPLKYQEAMPVIQLCWEALGYACAERLHPVLLETASELERHHQREPVRGGPS